MATSLREQREACRIALPSSFRFELDYKEPSQADASSFYPGATLVGEQTVALDSAEYFDVLRALQFIG